MAYLKVTYVVKPSRYHCVSVTFPVFLLFRGHVFNKDPNSILEIREGSVFPALEAPESIWLIDSPSFYHTASALMELEMIVQGKFYKHVI